MRLTGIVAFSLLLGACASAGEKSEQPASATPSRGVIATSALPAGYALLDPAAKTYLRVSGDPLVIEPSDEGNANVTLGIASRSHDMTMVSFDARTDGKLKLDFYISPDGERWQYTSSCPATTIENWPHDISHIAVANPRYVSGDAAGLCN